MSRVGGGRTGFSHGLQKHSPRYVVVTSTPHPPNLWIGHLGTDMFSRKWPFFNPHLLGCRAWLVSSVFVRIPPLINLSERPLSHLWKHKLLIVRNHWCGTHLFLARNKIQMLIFSWVFLSVKICFLGSTITASLLVAPLSPDLIFSQKFPPWPGELWVAPTSWPGVRDPQPSEAACRAGWGIPGTWVVDLRSVHPGSLTGYHSGSQCLFIIVPSRKF